MSTTLAGIPRVKRVRPVKVRPLEPTQKHPDAKKRKNKPLDDDPDDLDNAWRKK
jgi:hypothetical protein